MMKIIESDKEKCKLCYACIRACPAKAIKIEDEHAQVIPERCVGCGSCLKVCSPGALTARSDIKLVEGLLNSEEKVVAIVDPSISAEFVDITDYRYFVQMIKSLGFDHINEISFGVDVIARKYMDFFNDFQGKYYITTKCPAVIYFVEKYQPDLVDNLVPLVSPMLATSKIVRALYGSDVKVVAISPCVAAKMETERFSNDTKVDVVLTFMELRQMFEARNLSEGAMEYVEFDKPFGAKGSLFPLRRGMLQSVGINEDLLNGRFIITDGRASFLRAFKEFENVNFIKQHFDLFYCEGCIMGPGASCADNKFTKRTKVVQYVNKRFKVLDKVEWGNYLKNFQDMDFSRDFKPEDRRLPVPTEQQISKVLKVLGRTKDNEQTSCGACGYTSCREFSVAILQGLARFEMCHTFTIKNMNRYIKKLNDTNKKLSQTQAALSESEQRWKKEHQAAIEANETIFAMMQKIHSAVVIVDDHLKIIESNKSFIKLLGAEAETLDEMIPGLIGADLQTLVPFHKLFKSVIDNGEDILNRDAYIGKRLLNISVFTIKRNKVVGGIIRDMYEPDVRKDEVVARAKEVIRENLETVQQIAFLLGESASKTEKMLSSIINSQGASDSETE